MANIPYSRPRILFFPEAVTLAHIVRPMALAQALDPQKYEIHFASAYRYENFFKNAEMTYWPVESISYDAFISSVSGDKSAYDREQLKTYLAEEDALIRDIKPDLIVADSRLTLNISAASAGVPLVNINNAYWSFYRRDKFNPVPAYEKSAFFKIFPAALSRRLFPYPVVKFFYGFLKPVFHGQYLKPFNDELKERGLKTFDHFEKFYANGDWTLYTDVPEMFPVDKAPATHRYIGPILWSPPNTKALPEIPSAKPVLFVSFGSSNDVPNCRQIIEELAALEVEVMVATAGRFRLPSKPNIHVEEFFPGLEAAKRADLVICSGGSTAAYQALSVGTPVLGLPSNLDQMLAMGGIERAKAGLSIRADQSTPDNVRQAVDRILKDPQFKKTAVEISGIFSKYDANIKFKDFIEEILPSHKGSKASEQSLQTLPDILRRRTEKTSQLQALIDQDDLKTDQETFTYARFWDCTENLARSLVARGLKPGDKIGFMTAMSTTWEIAQMAVLKAGGVVVAFAAGDDHERLIKTAGPCEIKGWIIQNLEMVQANPGLIKNDLLFAIVIDESGMKADQFVSWRELSREIIEADLPNLKADDPAFVIFTSGTTGEPKAIIYTHRQIVYAVRALRRVLRSLPDGFRTASWLSSTELFQRLLNFLAIERGGTIHCVSNPEKLLGLLDQIHPDILSGVPAFYEKWERDLQRKKEEENKIPRNLFKGPNRNLNKTSLKYLISLSETLSAQTFEFFTKLGYTMLEVYTTGENAIPISMNRPSANKAGTVGKPLAPNEVLLSDNREVTVKGPALFREYWKFSGPPPDFNGAYFRTGDEGQWVDSGFLKLLGRQTEFIKTSKGDRIAPIPVEEHFRQLDFVDQAVLLGNGRTAVALLITVDGQYQGVSTGGKLDMPTQTKNIISKALKIKAGELPVTLRPKGIIVLNRKFSPVGGELTKNLKLRRRVIEYNFQGLLERVFESPAEMDGSSCSIWFTSPAQVNMEYFSTLTPLTRLRTHWLTRSLALAGLLSRCLGIYGRYVRNLVREPWNYQMFQLQMIESAILSLRATLGPLKGPLVKVGQTLSYLDVGLSPAVQSLLKDLQDKMPPMRSDKIWAVIRKSLGKDPSELFAEWEDTPLAAASISQIHLARLKNGKRVVVKVRYPGMEKIVKSDLFAVKLVLPLIAAATGIQNVRENFNEGEKLFLSECDFRKEAAFMKRFQAIFKDDPEILIPEVYPEYCSESVLTMDYVQGQTYAQFKATATQQELDRAGQIIYKFYSIAALQHGLFNADPHPGNYLFVDGRLCFLDFGFCKEWSREFIELWKNQTRAVIAGDLETFSDVSRKMGIVAEGAEFDYAALLKSYRESVELLILEDKPFQFTPEYVHEVGQSLLRHQLGVKKVKSPPEVLAFSRLFWGQQAIFADLRASINCHRLTFSILFGNQK